MCETAQPVNDAVKCPQCGFYTRGNFCGRCGAAVKTDTTIPADGFLNGENPEPTVPLAEAPVKRRKLLWPWFLLGGLVLALILFAAIMLAGRVNRPVASQPDNYTPPSVSQPSKAGELPNGVSQDEFDQLSLGMTYAQVSAIIGGDGTLLDSGETLQGDVYYIYGFPGEYNTNAVVYVTISNDVLTDISVRGSLE